MSNQDQKHDWRPGLVAGASDLPVGIISGAGGAAAADAILKKKLQSAPPERLARLEKLHGRVSHLGTGLIAGGAALAYADYMQRKHERELAEAKMSKVANVYLEKIALMMDSQDPETTDAIRTMADYRHDGDGPIKTPIKGSVPGAALGALLGYASSGSGRGALIGAGIAGAAGGYLGHRLHGERVKAKNHLLEKGLSPAAIALIGKPEEHEDRLITEARKQTLSAAANKFGVQAYRNWSE